MRVAGWESLLHAHILEARSKTFQWGEHDCVLWSADWVGKATGTDPAAPFRGQYSTEEGATQLLETLGFGSLPALASSYLAEIPVLKAQRGDILFHPQGMLGVCEGAHAYFVTKDGVTRLPFNKCVKAWKVD